MAFEVWEGEVRNRLKTEADINDSELQHGEPHMVEVLTDDGEPTGSGVLKHPGVRTPRSGSQAGKPMSTNTPTDPRSESMKIQMAEHFGEFEYEYREDPHTDAEVVHEDDQVIVVADHTGHELAEWAADFNMTDEDCDAFWEWNHEVARELTDHNWAGADPVVFDKSEI